MTKSLAASALLLLLITNLRAADDIPTAAPDEDKTRAQVDALVKRFTDKKSKATLGMLQAAMDLSISFGAPAWNDGDHDACGKFYIKTAETLCKAFPDQASATPAARAVITDLKAALERAKATDDMDAKAWTMRYVFDKTSISISVEAARATGMLDLGRQCLLRAEFAEAQDALDSVMAISQELSGLKTDDMPAACEIAPIALIDALVAQRKYAPAAATISIALQNIPQLPQAKREMIKVYGDPVAYEKMMDQLRADAKASPDNAAVQLLLGYEDFCAGRKASARQQFEKTLTIDKNQESAKAFLKQIKPGDTDTPLDPSHRDL